VDKKKKIKLLFVGNSPCIDYSGAGILAKNLCLGFHNTDKYEIRVAGWGYDGRPHKFPWFNYPDTISWTQAAKEFKPDILFLVHDVWRFGKLPELSHSLPNMKIVGHFTIDGDPLPKQWIPVLKSCDMIIIPSAFGVKVVKERFNLKPIIMIPEGVDLNTFSFQGDKEVEKERVDTATTKMLGDIKKTAKEAFLFRDKFTVFFAGMNQFKKNLGALLDGFSLFAKGKDTVLIIVLHSHKAKVYDFSVVSDYDITDLYSWRDTLHKIKIVDERMSVERIADIYKVADVLVSASLGEGWGLFVAEAMASGTIPILTDYSAFLEIPAPDAFIKMPVAALYRSQWNVNRAIVSPKDLALSLEKAYRVWKHDKEKWNEMKKLNYEKVKTLSWDICVNKIVGVFDDLMKGNDFIDCDVRKL